jgi:hypothetical protein
MQDANVYLMSAGTVGTSGSVNTSTLDLKTTPGSPRRGYRWTFNSAVIANASASAGTVTWTQVGGSDSGFTNTSLTETLRQFAVVVAPTSTSTPNELTYQTFNKQEFERGQLTTSANVSVTGLNVQLTTGVYEA